MSDPIKTTYAGYLTIPTSASAPLVDSNDTTIGGDIVKNFKAIGDLLQKQGASGIILDSSSNNTIASGVNGTVIGSEYSTSSGDRAVVLGSSNAASAIPYSVNTIDNQQDQLINGITGFKGISYGNINGFSELDLGIQIDTAEAAILEIDAIYIDRNNARSLAVYRIFIESDGTVTTTLLSGAGTGATFILTDTHLYLGSYGVHRGVVANIRYTILRNENFPSGYGYSYGGYSYGGY